MNINTITEYFDLIAPSSRSAEWDNDGIMLLSENENIKKVVLTLDVNSSAVDFAIEQNADLIISHHPFLFKGIKRIADDAISVNIKKLLKHDISVLSYHTRMDASDVGINQYILENLGLKDIVPFGLCENDFTGRIGSLNAQIDMNELCTRVKKLFKCDTFTCSDFSGNIQKIAVVSGGGSEYAASAKHCGADVFISGEFKHHNFIEAAENRFPVISIDHYHCENVFVQLVYELMSKNFSELEILKYEGKPPFLTIH